MGALHAGHLSLVARARQDCHPVFASIFVNPKQFGPREDFAKYPRTIDKDAEKLAAVGVNGLFLPEAAEMYPAGFSTYVSVEGLSERLEGRTRPGHFRGVTTVVLKLLEIVRPHFAYFGRKDAQQAHLITVMARDLNLDTQIILGSVVRESDGLAMSSRNVYLTPQERTAAAVLHRALATAKEELIQGERDVLQLQNTLRRILSSEPLARIDYVEIVDAESFEPAVRVHRACYILLAVYLGKTRLIDNILIEPRENTSDDFVFHL